MHIILYFSIGTGEADRREPKRASLRLMAASRQILDSDVEEKSEEERYSEDSSQSSTDSSSIVPCHLELLVNPL